MLSPLTSVTAGQAMDDYTTLYKDVIRLDDGLSEVAEKPLSDADLLEHIDRAIAAYRGDVTELSNGIGVLILGRKLGWRPTFLLHSPKTIRRYEEHLGLKFQEVLPEGGPKRHRLVSWLLAHKVSNFWKAVKGEIPDLRTPDWRKTIDGD